MPFPIGTPTTPQPRPQAPDDTNIWKAVPGRPGFAVNQHGHLKYNPFEDPKWMTGVNARLPHQPA